MNKIQSLFFIIFLCITFSNASSQLKSRCNANAFLNIDFKGEIKLYDKPDGKIIKFLRHDFNNEDYIVFTIKDKNDSMFFVFAYYDIGGYIDKGWIKKDKNIGIYSKAYNKPLLLYTKPNEKSKVQYIIREYNPKMYIVIDCEDGWLKVTTNLHGKKYIGWMPPYMQCCNVYSSCS